MEQRSWTGNPHRAGFLLHLSAALHLGFAIYYDCRYAQLPSLAVELRLEPPIGGKFKYMTFLSGLVHCGYYILALSYDLLRIRVLRQLRDYVMASFVVPLALTVGVTFWTLYAIDRDSIYPPILDLIYPMWLNHTMHSCVVVYALLELGLTRHRYPLRRKAFAGLGAFMAAYLVWIHFLWAMTGIWVYPFLGALAGSLRFLFFVAIVGFGFGYYLMGEWINKVIWGRPSGDRGRSFRG
ncbi:androgen-induced gene 1 protein [Drosophila kikkawai]|uniref:Androgen-induced gene 1 protein n=1 Tax=Drosophila kikkawai TaxID=30033 RepID=A0A6P4IF35_DROKI|nr:androgen-induced gene 1 protein [Drosophila kikkawai]